MAWFRRKRVGPVRLDSTPSGVEEWDDWTDERRVSGWNVDDAKLRVDKISRYLVTIWSLFLSWIIVAQGNRDGTILKVFSWNINILPAFHLESTEFIAVVTTTTASVFGFLLIVANHLFKAEAKVAAANLPTPPTSA